jgi:hypothetical protein
MTDTELKVRVYQQIAHFNEAQLEKLSKLLNEEFSLETEKTFQRRVGGKYKGQFVIHDDFDHLPDEFMAAFTND